MSTEYLFGTTSQKLSRKEGNRRDKIAQKFGGNFTGPIRIPGNHLTGWFSIANKGEPFNSGTANEILKACGLS